MIGGVLEVIRTRVLLPQASAPVVEERVWLDPDNVPLNVQPATAEVVGLTTTPINPEIGRGFGGAAGGTMTLRHVAVLVLTVEGADREHPVALRDKIVTSLLTKALQVDWVNATIGGGQSIDKVAVNIEYADVTEGALAAFATLVFTVDTEWTV